jgi:hypothetical protein
VVSKAVIFAFFGRVPEYTSKFCVFPELQKIFESPIFPGFDDSTKNTFCFSHSLCAAKTKTQEPKKSNKIHTNFLIIFS